MKKILLIGDSIRLSYQPEVKSLLEGIAEVFGPSDNSRFAKYTLFYINEWIETFGPPDIIHWNNGIWDSFRPRVGMDKLSTESSYMQDIKRIYIEIKRNKCEIIWATTTPIKEGYQKCFNKDVDTNNKNTIDFFSRQGVYINDLHSLIQQDKEKYICEDMVHLSKEGITAAAGQTAECIKRFL